MTLRKASLVILAGYLLLIFASLPLAGCGGGGGNAVIPASVPDITGTWAGTWVGTDPVAGQVTGNWEAEVSQSGSAVSGSMILSGDVDCPEGTVTGAPGANSVPAGTLVRSSCQQNTWTMTALDLVRRSTSGIWSQAGTGAAGTFTGSRIARKDGPRIAFFSPPGGAPGTIVTVVGSGFAPSTADNSLRFQTASAELIAPATTSTLVARVPQGAAGGPLSLTTPQETATSPRSFNSNVSFPAPVLSATIAVGSRPEGVAFNPDGRRAYVANGGEGTVSMINTATRQVMVSTPLGNGGALTVRGVTASPDGRRVYADYYDGAGRRAVAVLHGITNALLDTIPIGTAQVAPQGVNPQGIAVSPDGRTLYVANNYDGGTVTVVDIASGQQLANVGAGVGAVPSGVAPSPDGTRAYLAFAGSDIVEVFELASRSVIATIAAGSAPAGVAVSPDGARVYVANASTNSVTIIDATSNRIAATLSAVFASPTGIAVSPDGSRVYVVNSGNGTVSVVRTADFGVDATIAVSAGPDGIAVSHDGKRAYVSQPAANSVGELGGTLTLTVAKGGTGMGSVTSTPAGIDCGANCQGSFDAGSTVMLLASPDPGSTFSGWRGDPDCFDGTVTMTGNMSCTAIFSAIPYNGGSYGGGVGYGCGCFVATAAYGSYLDPHVRVLQKFRDDYLLTSSAGRRLVEFYYRHSPRAAAFIARHETLRTAARLVLTPLVFGLEYGLGL